jgi:hypothetical protein
MTFDHPLYLARAFLTLTAPALVLASGLKWALSRRQVRVAAVVRPRGARRIGSAD